MSAAGSPTADGSPAASAGQGLTGFGWRRDRQENGAGS